MAGNCRVAVIEVQPSKQTPVKYKGVAYVRIGAMRQKQYRNSKDDTENGIDGIENGTENDVDGIENDETPIIFPLTNKYSSPEEKIELFIFSVSWAHGCLCQTLLQQEVRKQLLYSGLQTRVG